MQNRLVKGSLVFAIIFILIYSSVATVNANFNLKKEYESDDDFDQEMISYMKSGHMPSLSTCIVKNDEVIWSKTYGSSDIRSGKEASDDTIYLVGSISKPVTATALLQLYEQGLFDLDEDVNDYLPFNLRNPKYPDVPITFRMLLAHQSSLGDKEISTYLFFSFLNHDRPWLEEYLVPGGAKYTPKVWRDYAPGERSYYSSLGFELLGYLIELISNQTFEEYCKENIFEPLSMLDTSFEISDLDQNRLATPYLYYFRIYVPLPDYEMDGACAAAGGLRTTILDLSHFLIAQMNGGVYGGVRILKEETYHLDIKKQMRGWQSKFNNPDLKISIEPISFIALKGLVDIKSTKAVPIIIQKMHNALLPGLQWTAAWALGEIGSKSAINDLFKIYDKNTYNETHENASKALDKIAQKFGYVNKEELRNAQ